MKSKLGQFASVLVIAPLFLHLLTVSPAAAAADETENESTPVPGTKEYFDAEKAKYEAQKAAIDAEIAAQSAKFPSDSITKNTGAVTLPSEPSAIAERYALLAASKLGEKIGAKANAICNVTPCRVLVTARTDVSALVSERILLLTELDRRASEVAVTTSSLSTLLTAVQKRLTPSPPMVGTTALGTPLLALNALFKSGASLAGFFKSDYDIKSGAVTGDDEVLLSSISRNLPLKAVREGWALPKINSPVIAKVNALGNALTLAAQAAASVESFGAKLNDDEKAQLAASLKTLTANATYLTAAFSSTADGKPGLIQRVVSLDAVLEPLPQYIVFAKMVRGGAMSVSRKHMFLLNPRVAFVGTATVSYSIVDAATGVVSDSGTASCSWSRQDALQTVGVDVETFNKGPEPACSL
jgi:hypothetical protein